MKQEENDSDKFLLTMAYGAVSILELASVRDTGIFPFHIENTQENAALVSSDYSTVKRLAKRLGGIYKVARVCGNTIEDLLEGLPLPEEAKFNWTVSGYYCDSRLLEETRLAVQDFLKLNSFRKSRFLEPSISSEMDGKNGESDDVRQTQFSELKLKELYERVLFPKDQTQKGFDVVVHGGFGEEPIYCYSVAASDVPGFESRDFTRSYQDPTITISPRLARILVNLAMKSKTGTLLDPFCGLGTILQEGLVCG
ncbi:MAG: hypothetical protein ACREBS_09625, partial [Nitrososphaerales archaeon]